MKFNNGDLVQSHYKARWIGIIISPVFTCLRPREKNKFLVKPLFTHDGRPQRKQYLRILHEDWLTKYPEIINDCSRI